MANNNSSFSTEQMPFITVRPNVAAQIPKKKAATKKRPCQQNQH